MGAPSTGILDDFSGPLSAWTNPAWSGDGAPNFSVSSGTLIGTTAKTSMMGWTSEFAAGDLECYVTLANGVAGGTEVRLVLGNALSSANSYMLLWDSSTNYIIRRYSDDYTFTNIGSGSEALSSGDRIGFQRIGTALNGWHYAGGSWAQFVTVTDATYTNMAYVGIGDYNGVNTYDNFGGGNPFTDVLVARGARSGSRVYR